MEQQKKLRQLIRKTLLEQGGYPAGAEFDSRAPWNQEEPMFSKPKIATTKDIEVIYFKGEVCILKSISDGTIWFCHYDASEKNKFEPYAEIEKEFVGKDEDGDPIYNYNEEWEVNAAVIENYINDNFKNLTVGFGMEGIENGDDIVKLDNESKNELIRIFQDQNLQQILFPDKEKEDYVNFSESLVREIKKLIR